MDINLLYAEFCNKFWIHFLGMENAQSPKTDTFLVVKPWLTPGFILVSTNSHSPFPARYCDCTAKA